ncbi:MAG: hypothetical protein M0Z92_05750 [Actinomycetota bacterium]|nr:hypothetical protein [Actinomycetota bacterium]
MSSELLTQSEAGTPAEAPGFSIVPIPGLIIAGAYVVALVVALLSNTHWAVDFFHVVSGALWTGVDLFVGFVIGPILGKLPIPARVEFSKRFMPKMVVIMPALVVATLAAGFQLARQQGYILSSWPDHGWVVASFVVVGVLSVVAIGVLEPANLAVLFELRKPHPNGELVAHLMKRFIYTAGITGAMQIATLVIMTRLATA